MSSPLDDDDDKMEDEQQPPPTGQDPLLQYQPPPPIQPPGLPTPQQFNLQGPPSQQSLPALPTQPQLQIQPQQFDGQRSLPGGPPKGGGEKKKKSSLPRIRKEKPPEPDNDEFEFTQDRQKKRKLDSSLLPKLLVDPSIGDQINKLNNEKAKLSDKVVELQRQLKAARLREREKKKEQELERVNNRVGEQQSLALPPPLTEDNTDYERLGREIGTRLSEHLIVGTGTTTPPFSSLQQLRDELREITSQLRMPDENAIAVPLVGHTDSEQMIASLHENYPNQLEVHPPIERPHIVPPQGRPVIELINRMKVLLYVIETMKAELRTIFGVVQFTSSNVHTQTESIVDKLINLHSMMVVSPNAGATFSKLDQILTLTGELKELAEAAKQKGEETTAAVADMSTIESIRTTTEEADKLIQWMNSMTTAAQNMIKDVKETAGTVEKEAKRMMDEARDKTDKTTGSAVSSMERLKGEAQQTFEKVRETANNLITTANKTASTLFEGAKRDSNNLLQRVEDLHGRQKQLMTQLQGKEGQLRLDAQEMVKQLRTDLTRETKAVEAGTTRINESTQALTNVIRTLSDEIGRYMNWIGGAEGGAEAVNPIPHHQSNLPVGAPPPPPSANAGNKNKEIRQLQTTISGLRHNITSLKSNYHQRKHEEDQAMQTELDRLKHENAALQKHQKHLDKTLHETIAKYEGKIGLLEGEREVLNKHYDDHQELLKKHSNLQGQYSSVMGNHDTCLNELEQLRKKHEFLVTEHQRLEHQLNSLRATAREAESLNHQLREQDTAMRNQAMTIQQYETRIKQLTNEITALNEEKEQIERMKHLVNSQADMITRLQEQIKGQAVANNGLEQALRERTDEINGEFEQYDDRIKKQSDIIDELRREVESLQRSNNASHNTYQHQLQELKTKIASLETHKQMLIAEHQAAMQVKEKMIARLQDQGTHEETSRSDLQRQYEINTELRSTIADLQDQLRECREKLNKDLDECNNERRRMQQTIDHLRTKEDGQDQQIKRQQECYNDLEQVLKQKEDLRIQTVEGLKQRIHDLQQQIQAQEEREARLEEQIQGDTETIRDLERRIQEQEERESNLRQQFIEEGGVTNEHLTSLGQQLETRTGEYNALERELMVVKRDLGERDSQLNDMRTEKEEYESLFNDAKQDIIERDTRIQGMTQALATRTSELAAMQQDLDGTRQQLETRNTDFDTIEQELTDLRQEHDETVREMEGVHVRIQQLESQTSELQTQNQQLRALNSQNDSDIQQQLDECLQVKLYLTEQRDNAVRQIEGLKQQLSDLHQQSDATQADLRQQLQLCREEKENLRELAKIIRRDEEQIRRFFNVQRNVEGDQEITGSTTMLEIMGVLIDATAALKENATAVEKKNKLKKKKYKKHRRHKHSKKGGDDGGGSKDGKDDKKKDDDKKGGGPGEPGDSPSDDSSSSDSSSSSDNKRKRKKEKKKKKKKKKRYDSSDSDSSDDTENFFRKLKYNNELAKLHFEQEKLASERCLIKEKYNTRKVFFVFDPDESGTLMQPTAQLCKVDDLNEFMRFWTETVKTGTYGSLHENITNHKRVASRVVVNASTYIRYLTDLTKNHILEKRIKLCNETHRSETIYLYQTGPAFAYRFKMLNRKHEVESVENMASDQVGTVNRYVLNYNHVTETYYVADLCQFLTETTRFPADFPYPTHPHHVLASSVYDLTYQPKNFLWTQYGFTDFKDDNAVNTVNLKIRNKGNRLFTAHVPSSWFESPSNQKLALIDLPGRSLLSNFFDGGAPGTKNINVISISCATSSVIHFCNSTISQLPDGLKLYDYQRQVYRVDQPNTLYSILSLIDVIHYLLVQIFPDIDNSGKNDILERLKREIIPKPKVKVAKALEAYTAYTGHADYRDHIGYVLTFDAPEVMDTSMHHPLPPYGTFVDDRFNSYDDIYILGDLHNNETGLLQFLHYHRLIDDTVEHLTEVERFTKNVMLVFLGDVIGKMKQDSTQEYMTAIHVLRFIEKHKQHCVLVIGNHEMRFLARTTPVDNISNMDITNMILMQSGHHHHGHHHSSNNNNKRHYHQQLRLYIQLEDVMKKWKEDRATTLDPLRHIAKRDYNDNVWMRFVIIAFIIQFGEFIVYFNRLKTYMFHGGLDFNRDMYNQQSSKICNIRTHNYKNHHLNEWFKTNKENCRNTTFIFAHDSDLCYQDNTYKPYIYRNVDKGNDFVCIDTNFYQSKVLSYVKIDPKINPFRYKKTTTVVMTERRGDDSYYRIDLYE